MGTLRFMRGDYRLRLRAVTGDNVAGAMLTARRL
jgi:hypothetical protein